MNAGNFVGGLLHAVTVAHIYHLKSKSYAEHTALGEFYEALESKVDAFAEAYQGCYGMIDDYPDSFQMPDKSPGPWLADLAQRTHGEREKFEGDPELQNIVDEIVAVMYQAFYKLNFLK